MSSTRTAPGPGLVEPPPPPRRRRRWLRALAVLVAVLLLLVAGLVAGVAWYFSGFALAVDRGGVPPVSVRAGTDATGTRDGTVVLPEAAGTAEAGLHGIRWQEGEESGWGVAGDVLDRSDGRVVREWEDREGVLPGVGATGRLDQDVFLGDPGVVGAEFVEVVLDSELGDLPAYRVPAPLRPDPEQAEAVGTWVVFVHGRGGQREEANRYLRLWHDLGHEVLVPAYRNDVVAPQDPSGRYGLGGTEWRDVEAAVRYALDAGADRVVLAGWSMGGAVNMQFLARSAEADAVSAVVMDAPVLDWRDTFEEQGTLVGLPPWLTGLAMRFIELRGDLELDDFDWTARDDLEQVLDVPVYLVHSDDDDFVPNRPSRAVAERLGEQVTTRFEGPADHTREWNVAPAGYEADMRRWFESEVTPAP